MRTRGSKKSPALPLNEQVRRKLLDAIGQGQYPAGTRLPPERELARQFGVGRVTVRTALAALEKNGHVTRHIGRGTFVRPVPPEPDTSRRSLIHVGILFLKYTDPLIDPLTRRMFEGLNEALRESGVVSTSYGLSCVAGDDYTALVDDVQGMAFDVFIVTPTAVQRVVELIEARGRVLQLGYALPGEGRSYIAGDLQAGMKKAVRALMKLGHRRIAFLSTAHENPGRPPAAAHQKEIAFENASRGVARGSVRSSVVRGCEMSRLFERGGPTAVITAQTSQAKAVLAEAEERGVAIPREMSLISFDDGEIGETTIPRFSGVQVLSREMGRLCGKLAADTIKGYQALPVQRLLEPKLIIRDTCAKAPQ